MTLLHKYSITQVLYFLLSIFIVGFIAFFILTGWQIRKVVIKGPIYNRITESRDIVADVMPPPANILESYLNALEISSETDSDKLMKLLKKAVILKSEFELSHDHWNKDLLEGDHLHALLIDSYNPAMEFYKIRDNEYIPAIKSKNNQRAAELALEKMKVAYEQHRSKIDSVVELAYVRNSEAEKLGEKSTNQTVLIVCILSLLFLGSLTFLYAWVIHEVGDAISQIL